jgi:anti-sigma factor RsiW
MTREEMVWRRAIQRAPRFTPQDPEALAARIRTAVAATPLDGSPRVIRRAWPIWHNLTSHAWGVFAVAATVLAVSLTFWIWQTILRTNAVEQNLIARDVVSSHIRSLMPQHLTDVPSSDRHTVKPWFAGRVPYALSVPEFPGEGFTLEGGRLDYVAGRTVAALVYRRRQHVINVYVWPLSDDARKENGHYTQDGYDALAWTGHGQQHWAVSDLNVAELQQFVGLFQRDE